MCGICGIASRTGAADVDRLAAMSAMLVHRGPDSGGEHVDGPVALAARRLSIIDLAGGDQPIVNEDGSCVVVQNGEIYNYPELRRELEREGHTFRTNCDTEVHLHLYEQHGPEYARRLRRIDRQVAVRVQAHEVLPAALRRAGQPQRPRQPPRGARRGGRCLHSVPPKRRRRAPGRPGRTRNPR